MGIAKVTTNILIRRKAKPNSSVTSDMRVRSVTAIGEHC